MKAGVKAPRSFLSIAPTLIILALLMASGNAMLGSFSTVQEAAKAELHLSDNTVGLIQGLAASLPLALLSIPVGLLVDRANRVRLLALTSIIWTVGTLLTAYAGSAVTLFAARTLAGLGANISTTIAISIVADMCRPEVRGRSLLLLTLGKYGGTAAAFALGGWLFGVFSHHGMAGLSPWRSVHLALGIGSAAMTALLFLVREPPRQEREVANAPPRVVAGELWQRRAFLLPMFAGQTSVLMADAAAAIWAAPILQRTYGLSPADFAGWMGAVIFGAGILGALIGGAAADFGLRSGRRGRVLLGAAIASGLAIPAALFPLAGNPALFGTALGFLLLGGTVTGLVVATTIAALLPNELRGLCVGAFIAIGGLIAFGAGPPLVTGLSGLLGGEQHLGQALTVVGLIVSVLGFAGFVLAMRHAPESPTALPDES
jgi:MFS family permease